MYNNIVHINESNFSFTKKKKNAKICFNFLLIESEDGKHSHLNI